MYKELLNEFEHLANEIPVEELERYAQETIENLFTLMKVAEASPVNAASAAVDRAKKIIFTDTGLPKGYKLPPGNPKAQTKAQSIVYSDHGLPKDYKGK